MDWVLDALNQPADSKMFVFGTKALEEFINRLEEWPQYCNRILKIPHLRDNHPELDSNLQEIVTRRSEGGSGLSADHLGALLMRMLTLLRLPSHHPVDYPGYP